MKKYILILTLLLIFPLNVFAKPYLIDQNLFIKIDDSIWYVFTRENLSNNSELDEIGITEEYLRNQMITNETFLDAILFDGENDSNNLEFLIIRKKLDQKVGNLHTYSNKEIKEVGESFLERDDFSIDEYEIYGDKYKYITLQYSDKGFNLYQFFTVINGYGYTFSLQKVNEISEAEKAHIEGIIDSVSFIIDQSYEKAIASGSNSVFKNAIERAIAGALTCAIMGVLGIIVNKINRKKSKNKKDKDSIQKYVLCSNCGCKVVEKLSVCPKCKMKVKE